MMPPILQVLLRRFINFVKEVGVIQRATPKAIPPTQRAEQLFGVPLFPCPLTCQNGHWPIAQAGVQAL
jgi:hypothetical protein